MKKNLILVFLTLILLNMNVSVVFGQTKKELNKTQKGTIVGASTGAVIGGMIGNKKKSTALGAILGATIGGAAGAVIGNKMDKKAEKLEEELGKTAKVERVGEGIKLTFDSKLLFDFGKSNLRPENKETLRKFAANMNQSTDTDLMILGHTDNVGSDTYNKSLSVRRAMAVTEYLKSLGLKSNRLKSSGKGEAEPIENNNTETGKAQNRRVEIAIYANEEMKKEAKSSL